MKLSDYQQRIKKFAVYPAFSSRTVDQSWFWRNPWYCGMGLVNEAGELQGTVGIQDLALELGDVLWYATMLATELNVDAISFMVDEVNESLEKLYSAELIEQGINILDPLKKLWRDGYDQYHLDSARNTLGQIFWLIQLFCKYLNTSLEDIAQLNYGKLSSRAERNVLHGTGSYR
jgi:NTP pyrophosphatase (non-canonical NTP hydrolase)